MSGIKRLSRSSAAIVLALAIVGVVYMNVTGKVDGTDALDFIKWLVAAFFGKMALEDAAAKLNLGRALVKKEGQDGGHED